MAASYFSSTARLIPQRRGAVALMLFVLVGAFISGLCEALHRARRRIGAGERQRAEEARARPRNASVNWRRTPARSSGSGMPGTIGSFTSAPARRALGGTREAS